MDIFLTHQIMKKDKHILFDHNVFEGGLKLAKDRRQSFTAMVNAAIEKEIRESEKYLTKHN